MNTSHQITIEHCLSTASGINEISDLVLSITTK